MTRLASALSAFTATIQEHTQQPATELSRWYRFAVDPANVYHWVSLISDLREAKLKTEGLLAVRNAWWDLLKDQAPNRQLPSTHVYWRSGPDELLGEFRDFIQKAMQPPQVDVPEGPLHGVETLAGKPDLNSPFLRFLLKRIDAPQDPEVQEFQGSLYSADVYPLQKAISFFLEPNNPLYAESAWRLIREAAEVAGQHEASELERSLIYYFSGPLFALHRISEAAQSKWYVGEKYEHAGLSSRAWEAKDKAALIYLQAGNHPATETEQATRYYRLAELIAYANDDKKSDPKGEHLEQYSRIVDDPEKHRSEF